MESIKKGLNQKIPNRLIAEKSPYLLQHAYNPVNWHPWDDMAINEARTENKPIILSIGYSTCHWCHVMEKESFENLEIADIMNRYFISIKVDREERPDIDTIYMSAVTAMNGSGGWPLNVFLTPDLKPFFGGTYFPAVSNFQMISWPALLKRIAQMWENEVEQKKILKAGESLTSSLGMYLSNPGRAAQNQKDLSLAPLDVAYSQYLSNFDEKNGGFGSAPKFPSPGIQNFLFTYGHRQQTLNHKKAMNMAIKTLGSMAKGGIYDHIGGGFHRYSTDARWHVPHFEKMLYDNAQLIINYLEAFQFTRDRWFKNIAMETADYIIRDMAREDGGFYSAEDADSIPGDSTSVDSDHAEKIEGAFYVWEKQQIDGVLGSQSNEAGIFCNHYNIAEKGNVDHDPHGYFEHKNVLFQSHDQYEDMGSEKLPPEDFDPILKQTKDKLFKIRNTRHRPHLDDKILTSWNGLMISALSRAYQTLEVEQYLAAAQKAALFIRKNLYDRESKQLYRRWREGERKVTGMAEDYAYLIQGLLDLYASDFDMDWIDWAVDLMETQVQYFYDKGQGGFFMTRKAHDANLILRVKEENDSVVPSANAVSAINLIRMSRMFDRSDFHEMAKATINYFYTKVEQFPSSMPQMLVALNLIKSSPVHLVITGEKINPNTRAMLTAAWSRYIPGMTVMLLETSSTPAQNASWPEFIRTMQTKAKISTAYLCNNFSCQKPITDPDELEAAMNTLSA